MPSPRTPGRRVAPRAPSRLGSLRVGRWRPSRRVRRGLAAAGAASVLLAAIALVVLSLTGRGPSWAGGAAAVLIGTAYTAALAVRTGGRPVVFGALALAIGLVTTLTSSAALDGGAAVLTAVVTGVLAVMVTVPAVRTQDAAREALVATLVAGLGAFAVAGFRPEVSLERFDYLSLALAFLLATGLVFRLGAGLHGLGRRGMVVVLVGSVSLALTLLYAELLRSYGPPEVVDAIVDGVRRVRATLGAVPRPIQVLVGVPALVWGTHMRARRRQGWWVCAFGVATTVSVAGMLVNPATRLLEAGLVVGYSLVLGLVLGYLVIRLDLVFTAPRGRRGRRAEERAALRPEPTRFGPLL